MITSQRIFETESIDLASFLVTATLEVNILLAYGGRHTLFAFSDTDELRNAIIAYECDATLPEKKLLNARSHLFREASRVVASARG